MAKEEEEDSSRKLICEDDGSSDNHQSEFVIKSLEQPKPLNNKVSRLIHDNNSDSNYNSNEDEDEQQTTRRNTQTTTDSNQKGFDDSNEEQNYNSELLNETRENSIYNECTIPIIDNGNNNISSTLLTKATQISSYLAPLATIASGIDNNNNNNNYQNNNSCSIPINNGFNGVGLTELDVMGAGAGVGQFTVVDLNKCNMDLDQQGYDDDDHDADDRVLASPTQVKFTNNKPDMFQSINNLRLNVNNHIIGGSKNVMGRMRKLSLNELNRHSAGKSGRKYKIAFYVALSSLSILFLYLIYQNLFNDR